MSGGAVCTAGEAQVHVQDESIFLGNVAKELNSGGAIAVNENSRFLISGNTLLDSNNATGSGGAVAVYEYGHLAVSQSIIRNNYAVNDSAGGAIALFDNGTAVVRESLMVGNTAVFEGGGGILMTDNSSIVISGSVVSDNDINQVGGGLFCDSQAHVLIENGTVFQNNTGGAIAAYDYCHVKITGGSKLLNNTASTRTGGGGVAVHDDATLILNGQSVVAGNIAMQNGGGGIWVSASATAVIRDAILADNVAPHGGGVWASGESVLVISGTTRFSNNTGQVGSELNIGPNVTFSLESSDFDPHSRGVHWLRDCVPGEVSDQGYCRKCLPSTFSIDPASEAGCLPCPNNTKCTGGNAIIPLAGYWHSHRYSTQIHRCPHVDQVCGYNATCAQGYAGNLCGECKEGYGSSGPFDCGKCLPLPAQMALYVCAGLAAVLLVAITVHATWKDNLQTGQQTAVRGSDMLKVTIQYLQYIVIASSLSVPWPASLYGFFKAARFVFAAINGHVVSLDCLLAWAYQGGVPLAMQRQLVYLFAPLGIFIAVFCLHGAKELLVALAQSIHDLYKNTNSSGDSSGLHLSRRGLWSALVIRLPVMCVVVMFFSYPFLVRVSLGFFACVQLDNAAVGKAQELFPQHARATAAHGYLVSAMQQACFEGWHLPWALGLGLPSALLVCVGVPLILVLGLLLNKSKLQQQLVRSHFGFLYRPYVEERCWWEGVITAQTMLLVTVSVFRYTLGGYYSSLLVNVMFGGMAVLQLLFKPYASPELHHMQMLSLAVLYITTSIALSLFTVDVASSAVYVAVVGGLAVALLNVCFLLWCLTLIIRQAAGPMARGFAALKRLGFSRCLPRFHSSSSDSSGSSSLTFAQLNVDERINSTTDNGEKGNQIARQNPKVGAPLPLV
jgi:hypothetical protein